MSTILVTGAAGFIGSHLCERLVQQHQIIGVDNFDPFYDRFIKEQNLASMKTSKNMIFEEADITNKEQMNNIMEQYHPSIIIHLAAKAGVRPSIQNPAAYIHTNILGTTILLELAKQHTINKFILASSSSVYGNHPLIPFTETHETDIPISPYAVTKRSCELMAYTFHHLYQIPIACLRFFTVYGPRQRPDLAIQKFLLKTKNNQAIDIFGDGSSSRDYTYIEDIIDGIIASLEKIETHGFRIWNLGGDTPVTLQQLLKTIEQVTQKQLIINQLPAQEGDVERTYADLSRSQTELGFLPKTKIEEGIKKQWQWICQHTS